MVPLSFVKCVCLYHCQLSLDKKMPRLATAIWTCVVVSRPNLPLIHYIIKVHTCLINCLHLNTHHQSRKLQKYQATKPESFLSFLFCVEVTCTSFIVAIRGTRLRGQFSLPAQISEIWESLSETWSDRASGSLTKKTLQVHPLGLVENWS